MNGTLLHVTRQDVACFVLCVLIKIPCLINNIQKADTFHMSVEPFRVAPERLVIIIINTNRPHASIVTSEPISSNTLCGNDLH